MAEKTIPPLIPGFQRAPAEVDKSNVVGAERFPFGPSSWDGAGGEENTGAVKKGLVGADHYAQLVVRPGAAKTTPLNLTNLGLRSRADTDQIYAAVVSDNRAAVLKLAASKRGGTNVMHDLFITYRAETDSGRRAHLAAAMDEVSKGDKWHPWNDEDWLAHTAVNWTNDARGDKTDAFYAVGYDAASFNTYAKAFVDAHPRDPVIEQRLRELSVRPGVTEEQFNRLVKLADGVHNAFWPS
jgi:hypothetical protein